MKDSKEDEDGPGPVYKTDYLKSIKHDIDHIEPKRFSTFGINKDERAKVQYHG